MPSLQALPNHVFWLSLSLFGGHSSPDLLASQVAFARLLVLMPLSSLHPHVSMHLQSTFSCSCVIPHICQAKARHPDFLLNHHSPFCVNGLPLAPYAKVAQIQPASGPRWDSPEGPTRLPRPLQPAGKAALWLVISGGPGQRPIRNLSLQVRDQVCLLGHCGLHVCVFLGFGGIHRALDPGRLTMSLEFLYAQTPGTQETQLRSFLCNLCV